MDVLTLVWDDTVALVKTVWPEVSGEKHPIWRVTQAERFAWRKLMDEGKLEAPWVVVGYGAQSRAQGWGATNTMYQIPLTVYYIGQQGPHTSGDVAGWMSGKLSRMTRTLESADQGGYPFNVPDGADADISENNGVSQGLISNNLSLFCGVVRFNVIAGYVSTLTAEEEE